MSATDSDIAYRAAQILIAKVDGSDGSLYDAMHALQSAQSIVEVVITFQAPDDVVMLDIVGGNMGMGNSMGVSYL